MIRVGIITATRAEYGLLKPLYLELDKIKNIVDFENVIIKNKNSVEVLRQAKKMGFSDKYIATAWQMEEIDIYNLRKKNKIIPVYKMIDTCASEFTSYIPYFYSTYSDENESVVSDKKKIIVLGSGPIRIGQGVEFDYSTVHAVKTIKASGYEAIIIADHGNADNAINEDGTPNTAHSLNPVPFIYVTDNNSAKVKNGRLADVAPSILHIMGLEQPSDMTGENLIID